MLFPSGISVLTCKIEELGSELKEHYKIEAFAPILVPAQVRVVLIVFSDGYCFIKSMMKSQPLASFSLTVYLLVRTSTLDEFGKMGCKCCLVFDQIKSFSLRLS